MRKISQSRSWFNERKAVLNKFLNPTYAEIVTRRGLGFSFNIIDAKDLFTSDVVQDFYYEFNQDKNYFADRPWHVKAENKFTITFNKSHYPAFEWNICQWNSYLVHPMDDYPLYIDPDNTKFTKIQKGEMIEILITPQVTTTDKGLRSLSREKRRCLFEDERKLKYFKSYTKSNCEKECLSDFIYQNCSCVLFYHYRNASMEICDLFNASCVINIESIFSNMHRGQASIDCDCPKECDQITYDLEYHKRKFKRNFSNISSDQSILTLKYKVDEIYPMRRYQLFTFYDCISYAGGLLGLFAGISVLTIVELIYFFTLRLFVDIHRYLSLK
jgi:hypothetical protein